MINQVLIKEKYTGFYTKSLKININDQSAVIVKNLACGICGTDIDIVKKLRNDKAIILGHEGIGRIHKVYKTNIKFKINDLIVYNPVSPINVRSVLGHSYDGIFSTFRVVTLKEIENSIILPIPDNVQNWFAALLEPLSTVVYSNEIINKITIPKDILIIGTGAIAHVIAFFFLKRNCNIDMISRSESRVSALKKRTDSINYINIFPFKQKRYNVIFCCASREFSLQCFNIAEKYSTKDSLIVLVNGFNKNILMNCIEENIISLNKIREINSCGLNSKIFTLISKDGSKILVTGHRGSSYRHFNQAYDELVSAPSHYLQLIEKRIPFKSLQDFFNNVNCLPISYRGKTLVEF